MIIATATAGLSFPTVFSRIAKARFASGSESAYRSSAFDRSAEVKRLDATHGFSGPNLFSLMERARVKSRRASGYLP